jgi:hypothetical protein
MTSQGKVWEAKLDDKYDCVVQRTGDYAGELTITADSTVLHREAVGLSYGAIFGPDVADVREWEDKCIGIVDPRAINP